MAQHQVVATKPKLTQKQSTETVQVMLYTSASMLCRIRNIFPSSAFEVVEFAEDDELYTFDGLMNERHPCRAQTPSPSSTPTRSAELRTQNVPLLKRGRSVRADQFLDSLNTAFEALHRGTLHALRIPFMGDPDVNSDSLELWSFRVIYNQSAEGEREVQGLEANLGNEEMFDSSLCVIDLLQNVSEQCERLPQLPDDRYIQPSILYKSDGWEPKGYVETQSQQSVKGFAGWQPYSTDLGIICGLHHDASQIDDDIRRRSSLENMLKPSSIREDDFATQVRTTASQMLNDENSPSPELAEHMKTYNFLTSETAHHLWTLKCELQTRPNITLTNEFITSCRCQLHDSMEDMIRCSVCGVQQHSICQGYLGDDRQPPQHICHLCLFGSKVERATLAKLCELALERRAIDLLLSGEVDNTVELSRKLDLQFDKVAGLVTSLVSQNFVVEQSGRSTRNSQGKITFPKSISTPEYIDSLAKLFDPYQVVGHHFSDAAVSDDSATDVAQTLRAKYAIPTQLSSTVTPSVSPEYTRAMTANASKKPTGSATTTTKKRARTSQPGAVVMDEQPTPVRQSSRLRTPTPKMKEAKFGFFINGQNLPSREHPEIKSKRFKGDS
ncbi:hypothetical protein KCU71_g13109, partial [Aureobasidium melanogenum]